MTTAGTGMQALRYHVSVPRFLLAGALGKRAPVSLPSLRLERIERPVPPPGWQRLEVRLSGVCGSDLGLLFGRNSPRLSPFFSFPAVLGHEIVAEVEGSRVAINPVLACADHGLEPCSHCRRGDDHLCQNIAEGPRAPGMIGYNRDTPGGWGEFVVAPERRLHALPDSVPDERAVLAEPYAVALRGARMALERGLPKRLLVIGSGSIGLSAIAALRHVGFAGELHVLARHAPQREAALALGADQVHGDVKDASAAAGARSYRTRIGPPAWRGGFDAVIDAAGTASSLDAAAWAAREGGVVVLLGATGSARHDFSPHWFREVELRGSFAYRADDFAEAVSHLSSLPGLEAIVSRRYALSDYRVLLADVRTRRVLKAVFEPAAGPGPRRAARPAPS